MPNILSALKREILRLAKKEANAQVVAARKMAETFRREAAELKRLLRQKDRELAHFKKQRKPTNDDALTGVRFSAKSVKSQRRRLGLSAGDYGKLVGASALTVLHWESGLARPRKRKLAALVAVRGISKREALRRLAK